MNYTGVVGRGKLLELFPNFKNDIQENGIDLRIGKVEVIDEDNTEILGCVKDLKLKPSYKTIEPNKNVLIKNPSISGSNIISSVYTFEPGKFYFITLDRTMDIPDGYTQIYLIRSSFARCGLELISSVGDNGYSGSLKMGVVNHSNIPITAGVHERIVQALTFYNDGTASKYDGDYQNDKIYQE